MQEKQPYLTLDEYKQLVDEDTQLTPKEFKKLLRKASALFDVHTRRFYQRNELTSDLPMRRDAFKLAIAYQIEYMEEVEATTTYGMQEPDSWSIGRMSVTTSARSASGQTKEASILCHDSIVALSGTGLLYRGVRR